MINYYQEKPVLKYQRTSVEMGAVVEYLKSLSIEAEVKRTTYVIFRNESANGKAGINNNYGGFQADSGRWQSEYDSKIVGTVLKVENGTGKQRIFLAFNDFKGSIDMLSGRVKARGLYVGGYAHKIAKMDITNPGILAIAYKREWVTGNPVALTSNTEQRNFLSMYGQSEKLFK
jgi:hypothetical protein